MGNNKKINRFLSLAMVTFAVLTIIIILLLNLNRTYTITSAKAASLPLSSTPQKKIGYITKVYEKNGNKYLTFDEVEFLTGKEATEAARKDGKAILENGEYYVMDDYYIVHKNKQVKDYTIDKKASLKLLGFMVSPRKNDISNRTVSYEKFKTVINNKNYPKLCYIYVKNNVITKIESQYVP